MLFVLPNLVTLASVFCGFNAICVVAQFFCLTASVTSASRMMFAFSRDGAVPGNRYWRRVSRHRVPVYAVFAIGTLSGLLMVPAIWNRATGARQSWS